VPNTVRKTVGRVFLELSHTIPNLRRDFPEWHLGRSRFAIWAIDVDCPAVRQQVRTAETHLSDFLLAGYHRQPHITLSTCGFPSNKPEHADDFGEKNLKAQILALRQACLSPFEVEIGSLGSFPLAPFLYVRDTTNSIAIMRTCLNSSKPNALREDYTPHVTVGLYAGTWPSETVGRRLDAFPQDDTSRCLVTRISLMSYAATEIGGPLTTIADYHLDQAKVHWHESSPFNAESSL